jgi:hypothetical protein
MVFFYAVQKRLHITVDLKSLSTFKILNARKVVFVSFGDWKLIVGFLASPAVGESK